MPFNIKPETPYTETEILLAIMNRDFEHADDLIKGMYINEITVFLEQLGTLDIHLRQIRANKSKSIDT